jgi:hypothetical protein
LLALQWQPFASGYCYFYWRRRRCRIDHQSEVSVTLAAADYNRVPIEDEDLGPGSGMRQRFGSFSSHPTISTPTTDEERAADATRPLRTYMTHMQNMVIPLPHSCIFREPVAVDRVEGSYTGSRGGIRMFRSRARRAQTNYCLVASHLMQPLNHSSYLLQ